MNDKTTELPILARTPKAITESTEEAEAEALVADLRSRVRGVRNLAPSRANEEARAALREELARMVATAQQLDAHLVDAERIAREKETAEAFADWANGGEDR